MGSPDGEGLSQLYLELAGAYKKRFMTQNGEVVVLKSDSHLPKKFVLFY